jgi:hypothetical protein
MLTFIVKVTVRSRNNRMWQEANLEQQTAGVSRQKKRRKYKNLDERLNAIVR